VGFTHAHTINVNMVYDVVSPFTGTFETLSTVEEDIRKRRRGEEEEEGRGRGGGERKRRRGEEEEEGRGR